MTLIAREVREGAELVIKMDEPLLLEEIPLEEAPVAAAPAAATDAEVGSKETASGEAANGEMATDGETSEEGAAKGPIDQPQVRDPDRFTGHRISLSVFEGPLDLLLYLVRAHRYDVCDIPISAITKQFIEFIVLMDELDLEYAGDFLVTAATLMQIKSRMLLPQHESQNEDAMQQEESDPRKELVERLLEYQRFQEAAETLKEMGDSRANTFARVPPPLENTIGPVEEASAALLLQDISTFDLLRALQKVLDRQNERPTTTIRRDPFTLTERVRDMFKKISASTENLSFDDLCEDCQSRLEVVITFLALLELISKKRVIVEQVRHCGEISVRTRTEAEKAEAAQQLTQFAAA